MSNNQISPIYKTYNNFWQNITCNRKIRAQGVHKSFFLHKFPHNYFFFNSLIIGQEN